uniref:Fibronectin type-III domain-containing protein n=1 Tax=Erpetoichthys calabaricus TaxID=27687 RepID=A0A8C4X9L8_ERPCA
MDENGVVTLTWQNDYPSEHPLRGQLQYQVQYKRDFEDWQNAEPIQVPENETQFVIGSERQIKSMNYTTRVRSRIKPTGQNLGTWSKWSLPVDWNSKPGTYWDSPNLICEFDGHLSVSCTWEVPKEIASVLKFNLMYQTSSDAQQVCIPEAFSEDPNGPVVVFQCEFNVTSTSEVVVRLKPEERVKVILPYQNIKLPPPQNLSIQLVEDEWILSWQEDHFEHINAKAEFYVHYKKVNEPWEAAVVKEYFNQISPRKKFQLTIPTSKLSPSSEYVAKVRTIFGSKRDPDDYSGEWSEWSSECYWKTEPGQDNLLMMMFIMVPIAIFVGAIVLTIMYKKGQSLMMKWGISIPEPQKSKVLTEHFKKISGFHLVSLNTLDKPRISSLQVMDTLQTSLLSPKDMLMTATATVLTDDGLYKYFDDFSEPGMIQNIQIAPHGAPGELVNHKTSQLFSFSGPYIFCPRASSLPDVKVSPVQNNPDAENGYISALNRVDHLSLLKGNQLSVCEESTGYIESPCPKDCIAETRKISCPCLNSESLLLNSSGRLDHLLNKGNTLQTEQQVRSITCFNYVSSSDLPNLPKEIIGDVDCEKLPVTGCIADVGRQNACITGTLDPRCPILQDNITSHSKSTQETQQDRLVEPNLLFLTAGVNGEKPSEFLSVSCDPEYSTLQMLNSQNCLTEGGAPTTGPLVPVLLKQVGDYCFIPDPSGRDWSSASLPGLSDMANQNLTKVKPTGEQNCGNPYVTLTTVS